MRFRVTGDTPPPVLIEAAAAYATRCCSGILDLWRDAAGYWQATLTHDLDCLEFSAPLPAAAPTVHASHSTHEDLLTPRRTVRATACGAGPWRATRHGRPRTRAHRRRKD